MDNKHFIWVTPLLLVIGFIIGYISGLTIPKEITIGMDDELLKVLEKKIDYDYLVLQNNSLEPGEPVSVISYGNEKQGYENGPMVRIMP